MTVLWYVHDLGLGHLARARAVIPHLRSPVVVATGPHVAEDADRRLPCRVVALPGDTPPVALPTVGPWHHAPSCPEVRARGLAIAECVRRFDCTTAVVDVSVEVVALARLLGLRVVAVRQSGRRDDPPHRIAHATADAVWVPQHRSLEPHVEAADHRWHFTGMCHVVEPTDRPTPSTTCLAVVVVGAGGSSFDAASWRGGRAPVGWRVVIAGLPERWSGDGIDSVGRVDDVGALLRQADVVVASAGWGNVADAAAAGARLVVIPEDRPFDEQRVRADALAAAGLALVRRRWPAPDDVAEVLAEAALLDPLRWADVDDGRGAERAAALIDGVHSS